jgi:signal transduction histidine kinase/ActR/RegA family two-component response regulator
MRRGKLGTEARSRLKTESPESTGAREQEAPGATLRARFDVEEALRERDRLIQQLREANERLVIATIHSDVLVDEAVSDRALAAQSAAVEAELRHDAESHAAELRASHEVLQASESEARASNRAKDDFLAMLGHELRNPLAPILLALDMIAMDASDPHTREHVIIKHQITQLTQLVDDLLDVARIRTGKIELRRQPVELADIVSRAVETASPLIDSKHHTLRVDVPTQGLLVDGDLVRLTQAVGNLLTNAAKYTPPRGSITVTAERRGPLATIGVRDTGIGISADMLPRIFDLFAQEQQAPDRAAGGLGLGLAIVRTLIALHGGTVGAQSEGLGRGTEVVIELPLLARVERTAGPGRLSPAAGSAAHKILVVDDNRLVADITGLALSKLGHDVRVAFDGPSALSIIEDFVPDVVFLDIGLPEMDGYKLANRMRAKLPSQVSHFFAITGYGQPEDRQRSVDAGFDEHLVKPVDLGMLQRCIAMTERTGPWARA